MLVLWVVKLVHVAEVAASNVTYELGSISLDALVFLSELVEWRFRLPAFLFKLTAIDGKCKALSISMCIATIAVFVDSSSMFCDGAAVCSGVGAVTLGGGIELR